MVRPRHISTRPYDEPVFTNPTGMDFEKRRLLLQGTNAVLKSLFDANTILMATTDNTPVALTVDQQTLIGRITGGAIASLTVAQIKTLLGVAVASGIASLNASTKVVEQPASITDHLTGTPADAEVTKAPTSDWAYDHVAAADPHTGYRLESADHSHQSAGAAAGQLDHGLALTGLTDDDHTQYSLRSILTTLGDIIYAGAAAAWTRLAGNITTTKKFLRQTGDGANSAAPVWDTLEDGDIPSGIARDTEVTTAVSDHSALTTGVHGVGAGTVAKVSDIAATKIDDLTAGDDNTDLDSNTTRHGLVIKAVAPAAALMNVPGIVNGETVFTNKPILDGTNPEALGVAAPGTAVIAAHRDHVHLDPVTAHVAAADPHTGYRLESADHSHQSTGLQAGQLDHGLALTGLTDDDHTQYIKDTEFTQDSGILVGTGSGTFSEETGATLRTSIGTYSTTESLVLVHYVKILSWVGV